MKIETGEKVSIINCSFSGPPNSLVKIGDFTKLLNCSIEVIGSLVIGNNCNIGGCLTVRYGAALKIGDYSGGKNLTVWCDENITIGNHSQFAKNCTITDSLTHSLDWEVRRRAREKGIAEPKPQTNTLKIGDDCWFGEGCKILSAKSGIKTIIIGNKVVVAAGAIVKESIPNDYIFYSGNNIKSKTSN